MGTMSGETPRLKIPYALGTDRWVEWPATSEAAALAVERRIATDWATYTPATWYLSGDMVTWVAWSANRRIDYCRWARVGPIVFVAFGIANTGSGIAKANRVSLPVAPGGPTRALGSCAVVGGTAPVNQGQLGVGVVGAPEPSVVSVNWSNSWADLTAGAVMTALLTYYAPMTVNADAGSEDRQQAGEGVELPRPEDYPPDWAPDWEALAAG